MFLSYARTIRSIAITAAAVSCFAAPEHLIAGTCSKPPCITYTASGTFATPQVSGADQFKLAGQPFNISLTLIPESTKPAKHGPTWAQYTKLHMSGTVNSGLDPSPVPLASSAASLELASGNPSYEVFALFVPVTVLGLQINITAIIQMPVGTLTKPLIGPFNAPVALTPSATTVTYADSSSSTTLSIATGSLTTTVTSAPPTGAGTTVHADNSNGMPDSGVRRVASEVHVRVERQDVLV